jgi:hypothetical protein
MQQSRNDVENGWMRIIHALKVIAAFHEFDVFCLRSEKMLKHFPCCYLWHGLCMNNSLAALFYNIRKKSFFCSLPFLFGIMCDPGFLHHLKLQQYY